ncbi:Hypothetical predicted protein [Octopus vulgaris]|uniref:Uncharacterized protein n=1 Tax=Octopus vulgaris TaxID=6645 RepID=A0AA36AL07_OCTVU|nr:Hypothetical predicted protein [Octopus vulgaris]
MPMFILRAEDSILAIAAVVEIDSLKDVTTLAEYHPDEEDDKIKLLAIIDIHMEYPIDPYWIYETHVT